MRSACANPYITVCVQSYAHIVTILTRTHSTSTPKVVKICVCAHLTAQLTYFCLRSLSTTSGAEVVPDIDDDVNSDEDGENDQDKDDEDDPGFVVDLFIVKRC